MKRILFLGLFFVTSIVQAKPISVDWVCPRGSSHKVSIEVSYDDQGKLQFLPDVFSQNKSKTVASDLNVCISEFQKNTAAQVERFKSSGCPSSKSDFCYASVNYVNEKVFEKIKESNLVKKNPGIIVSVIGTVASSSIPSLATTSKAYLEEKIAKKEINPSNLSQSFSFDGKNYKVSDFDDVVGDNIENVFVNLNRDEAKQYAQNYLVAKTAFLNANSESSQRTQILNNLNQMFGYIYGDKGAEELAKILECKPEDKLKPIEDIIKNIEDTNKVSKCNELKAGEHKVFQKEHSNYYSTGNYTLKRKQDGNYQAILNVKFVQNTSTAVSPATMLSRSQKCLALAAPHMKGPDGKTIEMVVLPPNEISKLPNDERPQEYQVKIEAPGFGTNAAAYAENVDCGVITHEMLHLMGLCDEYKEDRPQYAQNSWTCRVVTSVPSVMRDTAAFDQAVGGAVNCDCSGQTCLSIMNSTDENLKKLYTSATINDVVNYQFRNKYCKEDFIYSPPKDLANSDKAVALESETNTRFNLQTRYLYASTKSPFYTNAYTKIKCTCPTGDQDCISKKQEFIKKMPSLGVQKWCPTGSTLTSRDRGESPRGASIKNNVLTLVSSPQIPSLLQPNHFNKILEGNCPGKSDGYQKCASFAYKGEPCAVPDVCRDDKYYLGSEQQ